MIELKGNGIKIRITADIKSYVAPFSVIYYKLAKMLANTLQLL